MIKIDKKIVGYSVVSDKNNKTENLKEMNTAANNGNISNDRVEMHENIKRPEILLGSTYRIKSPITDHAIYVTINDIVLNPGTEHEHKRPYEVFINSKSMEHFQWIVVLTRIISALFRKGGDIEFIIEEMRSVFDPKGGYFKNGRYVHSLVAEIGDIIEIHLKSIGLVKSQELDEHTKRYLEEKKKQIKEFQSVEKREEEDSQEEESAFPENATICSKCNQKSIVVIQGCATCLNCGDSRCS